jgi:hypothetical protein
MPIAALTDVLAVYGAVVSSVTALAGYLTWRIGMRTSLSVRAALMVLHESGGCDQRVVTINMINNSHHEVAVTHVGFKRKGSNQHLFIPRPLPVEEPVPIIIPARRAKTVWVPEEVLADHANEKLRAQISTDDGHDFTAKPIVLTEERKAGERRKREGLAGAGSR